MVAGGQGVQFENSVHIAISVCPIDFSSFPEIHEIQKYIFYIYMNLNPSNLWAQDIDTIELKCSTFNYTDLKYNTVYNTDLKYNRVYNTDLKYNTVYNTDLRYNTLSVILIYNTI